MPALANVSTTIRSLPVRVLTSDDPSWDDWVRMAPSDIYHTRAYHTYSRISGEGEPFLIVIGDEAGGLAWPYLLRPIPDVTGHYGRMDVHSVYGYPGPVTWGSLDATALSAEAREVITGVWREQGAVSAFTRFHPLLDNAELGRRVLRNTSVGHNATGVVRTGTTISVDLDDSVDDIRCGYGRDLRRRIDRARACGLRTTHDAEWRHFDDFVRLYHETMVRSGATDYYFFGDAGFRNLRAQLGESLHLLVTMADGDVVSAGLFTEFGGIVEWYLVGSSDKIDHLSPAKVLVDDAIEWAKARGNRVLHIGGGRGSRQDSLFWFKSRFSPQHHPYHIGRWVLDGAEYDHLVRVRSSELTPGYVLDSAFFPEYRAREVPGESWP